MPTTSQILGLTPEEVRAAAFTASGEAGGGNDLGGVLQTILARKALNPKSSIVGLVKAPQQFVANDPYSAQQVIDPNFGQKVYGKRYNQALNTLENPNLMSGFVQAGQGSTSFRGQALLRNKKPGDIMFDPSGNFYFDKNPQIASNLIQRLGKPAPIGLASGLAPSTTTPTTSAPVNQQTGNVYNYYINADAFDSTPNSTLDFLQNFSAPLIQQNNPLAALQKILFKPSTDYFAEDKKS